MHALAPLICASVAVAFAPALLREMAAHGHVRANYRNLLLAFPFGVLIAVSAMVGLIFIATLQQLGAAHILEPETLMVVLYVLGVSFLGLLDDLLGATLAKAPRGVRAHAQALRDGQLSTGALKAAGTTGLALYVLSTLSLPTGRWLIGGAVLVLATHAFNLLDLRPGRTIKALVLLGAGLTIAAGARALYSLGPFFGPALVAGAYDLRERALLGDSGASALGALAGLWLVLTLSTPGQAAALAILLAFALFGEFRSISELVERLPLLRHLDCLGRPS